MLSKWRVSPDFTQEMPHFHRETLLGEDATAPRPENIDFPNFYNEASSTRLVSDMLAGVNHPYSMATGQLLQSDPTSAAMNAFIAQNPNLIDWLTASFPYLDGTKIKAEILGCGIVFKLPGSEYDKFAENERVCSSKGFASVGIVLYSPRLPSEIRDIVVLVNEGDGFGRNRSEREISSTQDHEVLHIIHNRFYLRAPFVSCFQLEKELNALPLNDEIAMKSLAKRLCAGMVEKSRGEIISHAYQGCYEPTLSQLCFYFWTAHFQRIYKYSANSNFTDKERANIRKIFGDAFRDYCVLLKKFSDWALATAPPEGTRPSADYISTLLRYNPFASGHRAALKTTSNERFIALAA